MLDWLFNIVIGFNKFGFPTDSYQFNQAISDGEAVPGTQK